MSESTRRRRWPAVLVIAASALAVGAVFGVPRNGQAAAQAAPANTATPTISGTPQEGSTLTASNGTWSGSPTGYAYAWSRCDQNGDACAAIAGANAATYQAQSADVGHTIRVTVTATNADGSTSATSAPTAVVSSKSAPGNTQPPTISGTPQVGSTLTAANGTWSGNPTGYAYAWSRCDQTGSSCANIGGATANTYQLKQVDAGATLPTTVNGCPTTGSGTIQMGDVNPPARLVIDRESLAPGVVTPGARTLQLVVHVSACNGRPVQGANVYAAGVPFNQYSVPPEGTTASNGNVTLTMNQLSGFPAARRQQLFVVFLRARKPGDPVTAGISTRLLVSFPVALR
jgi:hypothetical protein